MLSTKRTRTPPGNPESLRSRYGAGKTLTRSKRLVHRDSSTVSRRLERRSSSPDKRPNSAIITVGVGPSKRLFAAHKDILCVSPYFATAYAQAQPPDSANRRINLPDEQPEVFSCILEYLYKGDYYPRLVHNKQCNTWELEATGTDKDGQSLGATVFHHAAGEEILKDTAVYCAADKYGLEILKRLALRKQGLHSGIQCSTILTSARYAYANTPDTESKLRAHYLALIIRSKSTFKRSGTMQMEMEQGGKLFFDLFVAMCNHMDDLEAGVQPSLSC
ncbi:hypothetical protein BDV25DRAFT_172719 [Aspergillus avenaceus]|uniref:BTB domain-containing protein n=1 Tax=Aspergillus avenaceus TaxID=36643 RepID=A0A5N6TTN8_ASPAV|nr:hypothetical protein BDV25DRAFT_172719 [Aspergillus avenaceus]